MSTSIHKRRAGTCFRGAMVIAGLTACLGVLFPHNSYAWGIPQVKIEVDRDRETKLTGEDYDNQIQHLEFKIKVKNVMTKPLEDGKLKFYTIGYAISEQEMKKDRLFEVIGLEEFPLELPSSEEKSFFPKEIENRFDHNFPVLFGAKYYGYLAVVMDSQGDVLGVESDKPKLKKASAVFLDMKKGEQIHKKKM